jgi:hypothetical protein
MNSIFLKINIKPLVYTKENIIRILQKLKYYPFQALDLTGLENLDNDTIFLLNLFSIYKQNVYNALLYHGVDKLPIGEFYDNKFSAIDYIIKDLTIQKENNFIIFKPGFKSIQICQIIEAGAPVTIQKNYVTVPTYLFKNLNESLKIEFKLMIEDYLNNY